MNSIAITARLYNGFVSADRYSPAIDGILGYWIMRERLGPDQFSITQGHDYQMQSVDGLPLQRIDHGDWWWYACSAPIYSAAANVRKHIHRRFDQHHAERYLPDGARKVQTSAGAYKNARISLMHHITDRVTWHVVGDQPEIERLLDNCTAIGGKVAAGFGRVKSWEYAQGDDLIATLYRPLPVEYAQQNGVSGPRMRWGIRPPVRLASNQADCIMPQFSEDD